MASQAVTTQAKISVIIPVYNVSEYLSRCLDSVLSNTHQNLEIICINDGSTDNSLGILRDYETRDNRILVIDKDNGGVSSARNAGLDIASGEYISFIDSDDWIHPQYFESLLHHLTLSSSDIAFCDIEWTSTSIPVNHIAPSVIPAETLSGIALCNNRLFKSYCYGRLYRSGLFDQLRFSTKVSLAEDTLFILTLLCQKHDIRAAHLQTPLYFYYQRSTSIVHSTHPARLLAAYQEYFTQSKKYSDARSKYILIKETIKNTLSLRYKLRIMKSIQDVKACNIFLRRCLHAFYPLSSASIVEKTKFTILFLLPWLYRLALIMHDRTYLNWEKLIKQQATAKFNG